MKPKTLIRDSVAIESWHASQALGGGLSLGEGQVRTILRIDHVYEWVEKGKTHYRTYATLTDGEECVGYGRDFAPNDKVEVFLHYGQIKMRKSNKVIKE